MTSKRGGTVMTGGPLLPILVRITVPIASANLFEACYDIVNALWLGQLGPEAIAAVTASRPLFFVLVALGSGVSAAGAVLIAQNAGARRADALGHIVGQTLLMVAVMALTFALAGAAIARPALLLMGLESDIADLAGGYLMIRYVGLVPLFVFMALQAMLQSVGEVRFAARVQFASVAMNLALDPLLIFGLGPLPPFGLEGAACATALAQALALVIVVQHLLSRRSPLRPNWRHLRPDFIQMRLILGLGLPVSLEHAARTSSSLLMATLAASFGTIGLAAYGVGVRLLTFWFTLALSLGTATAAVVGQNIGAGLAVRASQAAGIATRLGFAVMTLIGLAHLPFVTTIMAALAPGNPEVVRNATAIACAYLPFLGFNAATQALLGAFRGAGSTGQAMVLSLAQQWAFQLPIAWCLALMTPLGLLGIGLCFPLGNAATAALGLLWLRYGRWRNRVVAHSA